MPNRLAASTSPYLLQHADNPVDWWEWGDEAFAEARRRDVPVLVSVGYAACHWCHVMAHESFEDGRTAAFMNAHFVNVKVDREERPDVDAVYMGATQAMTGQGGWPMTVLTTPDGVPFWCGTYLPPVPVQGMASFPQVLAAVAATWAERRDDVVAQAGRVRDALAAPEPLVVPPGTALAPEGLAPLVGDAARTYDEAHGGFGGAPKFPPAMLLAWLLRHHGRTGDDEALRLAEGTLRAMARGGIHDQLGGGFARYSVDAAWVVPHFEKMLSDNALLLRVYADAWRLTGDPLWRRTVERTAGFLLAELRTPEGGFAASLDADSPGPDGHPHEGAFYAWSRADLVAALGGTDAAWAAELLVVTAEGTFEHGASVLQLPDEPAGPDDAARWDRVRARLLEVRAGRARPARDDKVVAAWNGLAVAGLADAGALLGRADWVDAARAAADLLLRLHVTPGDDGRGVRLARASRDGVVGGAPGVLEDYADLAEGLLTLHAATGEARWVGAAGDLLDAVLTRFADGAGGFHDTGDDATDPVLATIRRPREVADGPTPSGQAAAAGALLTLAALTGSTTHRVAAERALVEPLLLAERHPRAAGWALAVTEALVDGPREVAVVGPPDDPATRALLAAARAARAPGVVLAWGDGGGDGDVAGAAAAVPLLADRPLLDGRPAAYVCRGFVCDRPTTDPAELAAQLTR